MDNGLYAIQRNLHSIFICTVFCPVKSMTGTCVTSLKLPCPKQPLLPLPNVIMMPLSENVKKMGRERHNCLMSRHICNTPTFIKEQNSTRYFLLLPLWSGLKQKRAADQPVMQVVNRSPQDTDLMVTPDWPSRNREMNWGCICSTAPGRLTSPDPTEGACNPHSLIKNTTNWTRDLKPHHSHHIYTCWCRCSIPQS